MIQFNLLPDVKKEYIKAKRTKNTIYSISVLSGGLALVALMFTFAFVQFGQKKSIEDLTTDINSQIADLKSIQDLDKILTIQEQLESLPVLHQSKPETSRMFTYLNQMTPVEVKIGSVDVDFVNNTMKITGTADSLASVNKYADTLKFATYKTSTDLTGSPFTTVLTELSRNQERAGYVINLTFDPVLFNNVVATTLIIPEQVTTRSAVEKPSISGSNNLFEDSFPGGGEQ